MADLNTTVAQPSALTEMEAAALAKPPEATRGVSAPAP